MRFQIYFLSLPSSSSGASPSPSEDSIFQFLVQTYENVHRIEDFNIRQRLAGKDVIIIGGPDLYTKKGPIWLKEARAHWPLGKFIAMSATAHGHPSQPVGTEDVLTAFRYGATDFVPCPFINEELIQAVKHCANALQAEHSKAEQIFRIKYRLEKLEGLLEEKLWFSSKSDSMAPINDLLIGLRKNALRGEPEPSVLICGEPGTGKETLAHRVHMGSRRSRGPWMTFNCAGFHMKDIESELFGNEGGIFSENHATKMGIFELAQGGTLFLDGVNHLSFDLQDKITEVIETQRFQRVGGSTSTEVNFRMIAAGPAHISARVKEGKFRERLYGKLAVNLIELPPLRARKEDIQPMAAQFAERIYQSYGKIFEGFTLESRDQLMQYAWPGNVKELYQVIARAALISASGKVNLQMLGLPAGPITSGDLFNELSVVDPYQTYTEMKKRKSDQAEKDYLTGVLKRFHGNVSAAARDAKIDRSNFLRLLRRHGLRSKEYRKVAA